MSIEQPENIDEAIAHCKARLGEPVLHVNVTDVQCRIAMDRAVRRFSDYHDHALDQAWVTHTIAATDIVPGQDLTLTLPDFVKAPLWVQPLRSSSLSYAFELGGLGFWRYGHASFGVHVGSFAGMTRAQRSLDLYLAQRDDSYWRNHVNEQPTFNWNPSLKQITIAFNSQPQVGDIVAIRAMVDMLHLDSKLWSEHWLLDYATALIKRQWGENLIKYRDPKLPGGIELNSSEILSSAIAEIERLEERLENESAVAHTLISIG